MTRHALAVLLVAAFLALTSAVATASQPAREPAEILLDASDALAALEGGSASFAMTADTDSSLARTLPEAAGTVRWRRAADDRPSALRLTGKGKYRRDAEEADFDAVYTPETLTFLDHKRKELVERPRGARADARLAAINELDLSFLVAERPLDEALGAVSVELEGEATVGGEPCDLVLATLPPAPEGESRRKYGKERWAIARADGLPRRVERIGDFPMIGTITVTITLTDLDPAAPAPGDVTLTAPEGYREIGGANKHSGLSVTRTTPSPGVEQRPARPRPEPASPSFPAAPDFVLTNADGETYTNETQRGRVTVLYFWGTWCVGCGPFSPLVSDLAAETGDRPIDVLGLAVNEANPSAARSRVADDKSRFKLVLGAEGLISPLRVRVYPTIVVIGPDNGVRLSERARPDTDAAEIMRRVRDAIDEALPPADG